MVWNHRVVRRVFADGEVTYAIHEAYYPDRQAHTPDMITDEPIAPLADDLEGLRETLNRMLKATEHPVIDYDDAQLKANPRHDYMSE